MEWINIKDKEPPDNKLILVTDGFEVYTIYYRNEKKIKYWMELPEPPRIFKH